MLYYPKHNTFKEHVQKQDTDHKYFEICSGFKMLMHINITFIKIQSEIMLLIMACLLTSIEKNITICFCFVVMPIGSLAQKKRKITVLNVCSDLYFLINIIYLLEARVHEIRTLEEGRSFNPACALSQSRTSRGLSAS